MALLTTVVEKNVESNYRGYYTLITEIKEYINYEYITY